MITDPFSVNNAVPVAQSYKRTAQNGAQSDWINSTTNSTTDRGNMRVSHQLFGKGGVSRRSLVQITRKVTDGNGLTELVTMNLTITQPDVRKVITDTQMNDVKAQLHAFIGNSPLWGNILLGES